jgi:uncharacterized pyridoxal phosphate-containing UPF0001 family protein
MQSIEFKDCQNVRIIGVMGMASFVENRNQIRSEFRQLKAHFEFLKRTFFKSESYFSEISMGMSGDYHIAMEEGSTLIRVGSSIFGGR